MSGAFILLALPLLGAFINGVYYKKSLFFASVVACTSSFVSFFSALFLLKHLLESSTKKIVIETLTWVNVGDLNLSFSFLLDPLSMTLVLIITGVGFLIHLFSVYYMAKDLSPARYFAYLNLFLFSMMLLVLADNLLVLFIGWEMVGLCSYLLIGFWFQSEEKAKAGMKAFIVNRVGDVGFLSAMLAMVTLFGTLHFDKIAEYVSTTPVPSFWLGFICLCLLIGAVGKSAQIPLFIWLPDAMAGPTPVSALIHAATMVTAGVYLIARMHFLFVLSPFVLTFIAWLGALTALMAGVVACFQDDIKKVLAYSTVSQLGYMFIALGLGAFSTALFHLTTHAFFKALLFLSAGVVIHTLKGEQNIFKMGGLKKYLPFTWAVFLIGTVALMGLPPSAGFFSKDEILLHAFNAKNWGIFGVAFLSALLTAFYMSRLFVLVFHGSSRLKNKPHKLKGISAKLPLVLLSILSLIGGGLALPHFISNFLPGHPPALLYQFLKPVWGSSDLKVSLLTEVSLMVMSVGGVCLVSVVAIWFYLQDKNTVQKTSSFSTQIFKNAGFWDFFCQNKLTSFVLNTSYELRDSVDLKLIQGFLSLIPKMLLNLHKSFLSLQTGRLQDYALFILFGMVFLILIILW